MFPLCLVRDVGIERLEGFREENRNNVSDFVDDEGVVAQIRVSPPCINLCRPQMLETEVHESCGENDILPDTEQFFKFALTT